MNIHDNLFYDYEVMAEKNGDKISFDIELKDLQGRPDCKIGNFYRNFWYRTKKAIKMQPYKTDGQLRKAIKLSLINRGYKNITFNHKTI